MESNTAIDFVLPWVDGSDPDWIEQFLLHKPGAGSDARKSRFRDWGTLKYQFRAFELLTPWVRKIHFITWGHYPDWLNLKHEKLNLVTHEDYLHKQNLPVFNANPIEINIHRINDLSDRFVYLNDDFFFVKKIPASRFFLKGLPRDILAFNAISNTMIAHLKLNDLEVINNNFDKKTLVKEQFFKIFNVKYSLLELLKTHLLLPWPKITGFYDPHLPQPYLKETFEEVWACASDILKETSRSKFRSCSDVNQYLFRYWQLCKGKFVPLRMPKNYVGWIRSVDDAHIFAKQITSGKNQMICLCDAVEDDDIFFEAQKIVISAFEKQFPDKSSFEL